MSNTTRTCTIDGCESPSLARGWCSKHWQRWKHHGDPNAKVRRLYTGKPEDRFWNYVDKTDDCWFWTGGTDRNGYGRFQVGTRRSPKVVLAHRFAYIALIGPIPDGLGLDHRYTCEKRCVNPAHLRPATQKQNVENLPGAKSHNRSSGVRGVYLDKRDGAWSAQATHNGKTYSAGRWASIDEATEAARRLRSRLFTHNDADRVIP